LLEKQEIDNTRNHMYHANMDDVAGTSINIQDTSWSTTNTASRLSVIDPPDGHMQEFTDQRGSDSFDFNHSRDEMDFAGSGAYRHVSSTFLMPWKLIPIVSISF
jgi:hypothetical protein